jgi:hypothetical protein
MSIRVVLEVAPKRTFASAIDWPGWSRSGRSESDALDALVAAADRYAAVVAYAGLTLPAKRRLEDLTIVERVRGGSTTEFGAPGEPAAAEADPVGAAELERLSGILQAAWAAFDAAAGSAAGRGLRTGPRGGGRRADKIAEHVLDAERAYLSKLGSRAPSESGPEPMRAAVLAALTARVRGEAPPDPARTRVLWPPRYAVRRIAWHTLDHAWEIEDRLS